jgi:hypothetical protein
LSWLLLAAAAATALAGARLVAGAIRREPAERLAVWLGLLLLPAAVAFIAETVGH